MNDKDVTHGDLQRSIGRLEGVVQGLADDQKEAREESRVYRAENVKRLTTLENTVIRRQERERTIKWMLGGSIPFAGAVGWFHDKIFHVFK